MRAEETHVRKIYSTDKVLDCLQERLTDSGYQMWGLPHPSISESKGIR